MSGPSGSGKSTLAAELAAHLGVPLVDLDALHHEPGWRAPSREVFRVRVQSALLAPEARGGAVVAGNYSMVRDLTWGWAETIIWLDFSLGVTLPRLVQRSWRRSSSNVLLWGTNREPFWPQFKLWRREDSLLAWNITRRRAYVNAIHGPTYHQTRFIRVRSPREAEQLRRDLGLPAAERGRAPAVGGRAMP